jgi:hypothetical protein
MPEKIITEVVSSEELSDGVRVTVKTEKLSPVPTDILVRERARARAIVEAGIADTVSEVFTGPYKVTRLTSVENVKSIDSEYPSTKEFVVLVRQ